MRKDEPEVLLSNKWQLNPLWGFGFPQKTAAGPWLHMESWLEHGCNWVPKTSLHTECSLAHGTWLVDASLSNHKPLRISSATVSQGHQSFCNYPVQKVIGKILSVLRTASRMSETLSVGFSFSKARSGWETELTSDGISLENAHWLSSRLQTMALFVKHQNNYVIKSVRSRISQGSSLEHQDRLASHCFFTFQMGTVCP